ncbi:sensor domain-containing diguanylate cyclase [Roseibium aestuarii]|uniref:Diguanylate cyclase n=1 Tax=Roseibium aestuarii TaxID=2600299 RepID=A0ABW4JYG3_9HYPH|nr:diguanylate cyclase [Roseibium aestuarii]
MPDSIVAVDVKKTFGAMEEAIAILTPERVLTYVNEGLLNLFGYDESELIGQTGRLLYADTATYEQLGNSYTSAAQSLRHFNFKSEFRRKDGSIFKAAVTLVPLTGEAQSQARFLLIGRDISKEIELEEKVRETSDLLREAIEAISEGFAMYDKNDRLVICNRNYQRIYQLSEESMKDGNTFTDILKFGLKAGQYDLKTQTAREWLTERMERHLRADGEVHEQHLGDGRWLRVSERRTPRGYVVGIRTDITNLKHTQKELQEAYANMAILTDSLHCSIVEVDLDGTCVFINDYGASWYDAEPDALIGRRFRDLLSAEHIARTAPHFREALNGHRIDIEAADTFPDGLRRELHVEYIPKYAPNGSLAGVIIFSTDITERKKTDRSLASLYQITATQELSANQKIQQILRIGCEHFDLPFGIVSNIVGDNYSIVWAESPNNELKPGTIFPLGDTYCTHALSSNSPLAIPHTAKSELALHPCYKSFALESYIGVNVRVNGERYGTINFTSAEPRKRPFSSTDMQLICQFADWVGHEIARERANEELLQSKIRLERLASIDDLTGIYNRRAFIEKAAMEVARFRRDRIPFTALVLDIDHFKLINDRHGHGIGDQVLTQFAEHVQDELRVVDIFGRIGGEEFCVILSNTDEDGAEVVCKRILQRLRTMPMIPEIPLSVTCSIGVAAINKNDVDFSSVMQRADSALYSAKEAGRDTYVRFPSPPGEAKSQSAALKA